MAHIYLYVCMLSFDLNLDSNNNIGDIYLHFLKYFKLKGVYWVCS